MKAVSLFFVTIAAGWLSTAPLVFAHHSFAAEFDLSKRIEFSGTLTKMEWTNPHTFLYLDVKEDDGKVTNWAFEMGSPNVLMRRGWTKNALKVGDTITVGGYLAKDGSHIGNARQVTLSDGRKVFAGSTD